MAIGLALALPHAGVLPAVGEAPLATATFERELTLLVNDYRQRHGLEPLATSAPLASIAIEHSVSMAGRQQFSHDGFRQRFERARSGLCVENLARHFDTPQAVLAGWQRSPSHDRNLLDAGIVRVGIAVSASYVTFFACR